MENKIHLILQKIHQEVSGIELPVSLLCGQAGVALFNVMYQKHFQTSELVIQVDESIQKLAEDSIGNTRYNLSWGQSGTNWFFSFLYKNDIIDQSDFEAVCLNDSDLMNKSLEYLDDNLIDFLHGAIGIAYYILYKDASSNLNYFRTFFNKLEFIKNKGQSMFLHYDFAEKKLVADSVNLSLSHGITSVLKFCLECIKQDVCISEAKLMAVEIIEYLRMSTNPIGSINRFPSMVSGDVGHQFSRLAWCYGDLGIAYTLLQASTVLNNNELKHFSLDILKGTTKRKEYSETRINDAGFCHGSIGVAHIYNALWYQTQDPVFKLAADYWVEKSIELAPYNDHAENYVYFNGLEEEYQKNYGLLEGSAGFGLALISYLTGDFSWDYCLMLN